MPLYVPLDVDFATDSKFLAAGPVAGYLFIASLALAKRTQSDGKIDRAQLVAISIGVPTPEKQAARLVEVGLWTETKTGWQIASWLKRNKSRAELAEIKERKRLAALKANHKRWHSDEPSDECPFCDPNRIGLPIENGIQVKGKGEGETKGEAAAGVDESAVETEAVRRITERRRNGEDIGPGLERIIRDDVRRDLGLRAALDKPLTEAEQMEALLNDLLLQAELVDGESREALLRDAGRLEDEIKRTTGVTA